MPQVIGTIYGVFNIRVMGLYIYIYIYIIHIIYIQGIFMYCCCYLIIYSRAVFWWIPKTSIYSYFDGCWWILLLPLNIFDKHTVCSWCFLHWTPLENYQSSSDIIIQRGIIIQIGLNIESAWTHQPNSVLRGSWYMKAWTYE